MRDELKIENEIQFDRVHRIGKPTITNFSKRPRKIVARFTFFKEREFVRSAATTMLKYTLYSIFDWAISWSWRETWSSVPARERLFIDDKDVFPLSRKLLGRPAPSPFLHGGKTAQNMSTRMAGSPMKMVPDQWDSLVTSLPTGDGGDMGLPVVGKLLTTVWKMRTEITQNL